MRKIKKVFGSCLGMMLALSLSTGTAFAAESVSNSNSSCDDMLNQAVMSENVSAAETKSTAKESSVKKTDTENSTPKIAYFYVRKSDVIEQTEDGKTTHWPKNQYTSDEVTREIKEYISIHGQGSLVGDGKMEEIRANLVENQTLPTVSEFKTFSPSLNVSENTHRIIWYTLKKESDGWHVDGVLAFNPQVKFYDYDGKLLNDTKENKDKNFYVAYKSELEIPSDPTRAAKDGVEYRFAGWRLLADKEQIPQTRDELTGSVVTKNLEFEAVYEEVRAEEEKPEVEEPEVENPELEKPEVEKPEATKPEVKPESEDKKFESEEGPKIEKDSTEEDKEYTAVNSGRVVVEEKSEVLGETYFSPEVAKNPNTGDLGTTGILALLTLMSGFLITFIFYLKTRKGC